MRAFPDRPPEVAALLNPAFCAVLLREAIRGYGRETQGAAMPLTLIPFVLPLALHAATRAALPPTTRTKMHVWLQGRPEARILFARRAKALYPYAREALLFGIMQGLFTLDHEAGASATRRRFRHGGLEPASDDFLASRDTAGLIGRWLGRSGQPHIIYAMWGVRP